MKKIKIFIPYFVILTMLAPLAACGSKEVVKETTTTTERPVIQEKTTTTTTESQ